MKKPKPLIAILLCAGLVLSPFTSLSIGFAKEVVNGVKDKAGGLVKTVPPAQPERPKEQTISVKATAKEVYNGRMPDIHHSLQPDAQQTDTKKIEEFMRNGVGMQDILKADDLSNKYKIPMEKLLKEKAGKKSWDEIEKPLEDNRVQLALKEFEHKYPEQLNQLQKENMSSKDSLQVITIYNHYQSIADLAETIALYKEQGKEGVNNVLQARASQIKIPKERLNKHSLTEADVVGVDIVTFDLFEKISTEQNQPLKQIIQKYKSATQKKEKGEQH